LIEFNTSVSNEFDDEPSHVEGAAVSAYMALSMFCSTGGPAPVTSAGRMLMLSMGFSTVILQGAYTANLASYLTISATPVQRINNMQDLAKNTEKLCVVPQYEKFFRDLYPQNDLYIDPAWKSLEDSYKGLREGHCEAFITTAIQWKTASMMPNSCDLVAVDTVSARGTGWVTNPEKHCIVSAFNWAIRDLHDRGLVESIIASHMQPAHCPVEDVKSDKLTIVHMGGVFTINSIVCIGAMVFRFAQKKWKSKPLCVEKPFCYVPRGGKTEENGSEGDATSGTPRSVPVHQGMMRSLSSRPKPTTPREVTELNSSDVALEAFDQEKLTAVVDEVVQARVGHLDDKLNRLEDLIQWQSNQMTAAAESRSSAGCMAAPLVSSWA